MKAILISNKKKRKKEVEQEEMIMKIIHLHKVGFKKPKEITD